MSDYRPVLVGGLISPDSRRVEPPHDEPHFHVWRDHGKCMTLMAPRFGTRQAAHKAARRAGMLSGEYVVRACHGAPCRALVPPRRRKPRKRCRHCGKCP